MSSTVDNPFFARLWTTLAGHEPECSLVLCSIEEPDNVLRQLLSLLRPGGELRYLEHVAGTGARARLQKIADATVWPWLLGNCHTHRRTEEAIVGAGFRVQQARRLVRFDRAPKAWPGPCTTPGMWYHMRYHVLTDGNCRIASR